MMFLQDSFISICFYIAVYIDCRKQTLSLPKCAIKLEMMHSNKRCIGKAKKEH